MTSYYKILTTTCAVSVLTLASNAWAQTIPTTGIISAAIGAPTKAPAKPANMTAIPTQDQYGNVASNPTQTTSDIAALAAYIAYLNSTNGDATTRANLIAQKQALIQAQTLQAQLNTAQALAAANKVTLQNPNQPYNAKTNPYIPSTDDSGFTTNYTTPPDPISQPGPSAAYKAVQAAITQVGTLQNQMSQLPGFTPAPTATPMPQTQATPATNPAPSATPMPQASTPPQAANTPPALTPKQTATQGNTACANAGAGCQVYTTAPKTADGSFPVTVTFQPKAGNNTPAPPPTTLQTAGTPGAAAAIGKVLAPILPANQTAYVCGLQQPATKNPDGSTTTVTNTCTVSGGKTYTGWIKVTTSVSQAGDTFIDTVTNDGLNPQSSKTQKIPKTQ